MTKHVRSLSPSRRVSNWRVSVSQLRACGAVGGALFGLAVLAPTVRAQTFTYTGTTGTASTPSTGGTFSGTSGNAFTDGTTTGADASPSNPAGTLVFGGGATNYTVTDDVASLTLSGGLSFTDTGTVTISTSNSSTITAASTATTLGFAVSTGTVNFAPAISEGTSTLTFTGTSGANSTTLSGIISGSGGVADNLAGNGGTGAGSIFLSGANTYTGVTTIGSGAVLLLKNNSGLGATGANNGTSISTGGELDLNTGVTAVAETITLNGTGVGGDGAIRGATTSGIGVNATTLSGALNLGSDSSIVLSTNVNDGLIISGTVDLAGHTLTYNTSGNTGASATLSTISGVISSSAGAGTGNLTVSGAGTLILTGTNTYSGTTTINSGSTLQISANGSTATLGTGGVTNNGTLVFDRAANFYNVTNVISGTGGAVTQSGANVVNLAATNTYTGATTVNSGTLLVSGSIASSAAMVKSGGTIGGTGILGAVTVNAGGTISAGSAGATTPAVGNLTTGALTLTSTGAGSTFNALLGGNTSLSTLSASGTTALAGNFSVSLLPNATFTPGALELITSSVSGTFTNSVFTTGMYNFAADYTTNPGFFDVDVSMVPEPSTWIYGFGMIGLLGLSQRRKVSDWLRAVRG